MQPVAVPRPEWSALPHGGCFGVEGKVLLHEPALGLALLRFAANGTIHEHSAEFDIDVICLEGAGFTSVSGTTFGLHAGERMRWPAGADHRLWTESSTMLTLMVEHLR